jgi:hypothetical protein
VRDHQAVDHRVTDPHANDHQAVGRRAIDLLAIIHRTDDPAKADLQTGHRHLGPPIVPNALPSQNEDHIVTRHARHDLTRSNRMDQPKNSDPRGHIGTTIKHQEDAQRMGQRGEPCPPIIRRPPPSFPNSPTSELHLP